MSPGVVYFGSAKYNPFRCSHFLLGIADAGVMPVTFFRISAGTVMRKLGSKWDSIVRLT